MHSLGSIIFHYHCCILILASRSVMYSLTLPYPASTEIYDINIVQTGIDHDIYAIWLERLVIAKASEAGIADAYLRGHPVKLHSIEIVDLVLRILLLFFFNRLVSGLL